MNYKTLKIGENLRESIPYDNKVIPLCISVDHFDDYFQREWTCHWHEEFEFAVVLKGSVQFTIYDGSEILPLRQLCEGDGIFISAGALHSAKATVPDTIVAEIAFPVTFFDMKPFESFYAQNIQPIIDSGITHCVIDGNIQNNNLLLSSIGEFTVLDEKEIGYELHCVELVCRVWRLLSAYIARQGKEPEADLRNLLQGQRVRKIMAFVHSHYPEHITVEDLAKAAAISRTECFRCFNAILKKTPIEYLLEYRLSMAAALLANTDLPLTQIAESCGFHSPSYFGKMFRQQCGLSPKKYRNQVISKNITKKRN